MANSEIIKRIKTLEEEILASTPSDAWEIGEKSVIPSEYAIKTNYDIRISYSGVK